MYRISASILSADFAHLADEVNAVVAAGVDTIHFDVMDHHYVPNLTVGAMVCDSLRQAGITATIDVHLMVEQPEQYIEPFAQAGANIISFHPQTTPDVGGLIDTIRQAGLQAGLVYNPDQPVDLDPALLLQLDMLLLMSVFPGFGGQAFITEVLEKIRQTRVWLDQHQATASLAVDGGVKLANIAEIRQAGADYFVLGSGIFSATDYREQVQSLQRALAD